MSSTSSPRYVNVGGSMVAKPINVRSSGGLWKPVQNVTAMFYLTPASGTYTNGSSLTVMLRENSLTTPVNSLQANLIYDAAKLQFVSSDATASPFTTSLQNSGGSGTVQIGLVNLSGSSTGDQLVSTLTFTVIGTGVTIIAFAAGSGIARASDSTNVCSQSLGGTYTLT